MLYLQTLTRKNTYKFFVWLIKDKKKAEKEKIDKISKQEEHKLSDIVIES